MLHIIEFMALSGLRAPIFCATIVAVAAEKELAGSMKKDISFSVTPTAADAISPMALIMAVIKRKDMLINALWNASGVPTRSSHLSEGLSMAIYLRLKGNDSPLFTMYMTERIKLLPWANIVASAAPAAPRPSTPTRI